MSRPAPSMLKATMIGGGVAGVLAGTPAGLLNLCCCALVLGGGFLAAFLYSRECSGAMVEFRPGGGALVGLVAGLFYAIGSTVVGLLFRLIFPPDVDQLLEQLEGVGLEAEQMEMIERFMESSSGPLGLIFSFFFWLVVAALFSTLGGLIGGAVFKIEAPAEPPPTPPGPVGGVS